MPFTGFMGNSCKSKRGGVIAKLTALMSDDNVPRRFTRILLRLP